MVSRDVAYNLFLSTGNENSKGITKRYEIPISRLSGTYSYEWGKAKKVCYIGVPLSKPECFLVVYIVVPKL